MTKSGKIMAFLDLLRLTVSLLVITAFLCLMYAPAHTLYNAKSFPALCLSAVSSSPPSSHLHHQDGRGGVWSLCLSAASPSPSASPIAYIKPHPRAGDRGNRSGRRDGSRVSFREFLFLLLFDNQTISEFSRKRHFIKQQF